MLRLNSMPILLKKLRAMPLVLQVLSFIANVWCLPYDEYDVCRQGLQQVQYCDSRRAQQDLCQRAHCVQHRREQSNCFCLWRHLHGSGDGTASWSLQAFVGNRANSCEGMRLGDEGVVQSAELHLPSMTTLPAPAAVAAAAVVASVTAGDLAPAAPLLQRQPLLWPWSKSR